MMRKLPSLSLSQSLNHFFLLNEVSITIIRHRRREFPAEGCDPARPVAVPVSVGPFSGDIRVNSVICQPATPVISL